MNTTYNQTIDQAQEYISVNSENGMLCLPTRLNGFKQTHFKQQDILILYEKIEDQSYSRRHQLEWGILLQQK